MPPSDQVRTRGTPGLMGTELRSGNGNLRIGQLRRPADAIRRRMHRGKGGRPARSSELQAQVAMGIVMRRAVRAVAVRQIRAGREEQREGRKERYKPVMPQAAHGTSSGNRD
jgi:hypothetical protein